MERYLQLLEIQVQVAEKQRGVGIHEWLGIPDLWHRGGDVTSYTPVVDN